jgi:proteasome assembly chaperone (PAC2) family protein
MRAATRKGRTIELDGLGKLDLPAKPTSPALIAAFEGWNDAGEAASGVINHLGIAWQATPIGAVDPEEFYDFQVTRPVLEVADGRTDRLVWPTTRLALAQPEGLGRDLVLVHGIEPNMRWRAFCDELVSAFTELDVELVILLGALLADSPHTRPVQVTAAATDTVLAAQLHVEPVDYKGPTGIVGVLQHACAAAGIPSVSLWAAVPHYVAVVPNPKGALALLRKLETLVGVTVDATELESSAVDYERQVSRAVEMDPDVQAFVERLERAADEEEEPLDPRDLPSGDRLASEFQRFLKQRGEQ